MDFEITPLLPQDWPQVREIFLQGVQTGLATFETRVPAWGRWDAVHHPFARLAARSGGLLLGWAALSPVSERAAYAGVAEVSIYVRAGHRGLGLGKALLNELVVASEAHGIWTLQAVIFAENQASLRLHQACGFRQVGRRERIAKRDGNWLDTLLLERRSRQVGL